MSEVSKPPRHHLIAMIVASVVYGIALPFTVMAAMFSPMASDSGVNTGVWIFIITMMTLPVAILAAVIAGWIFYATRMPRLMWVAIAFPLLWLVPVFLAPFPSH
jgi:hypothetical protein